VIDPATYTDEQLLEKFEEARLTPRLLRVFEQMCAFSAPSSDLRGPATAHAERFVEAYPRAVRLALALRLELARRGLEVEPFDWSTHNLGDKVGDGRGV